MVPTQSRERSGEILWMTVSRIPSYARRWPFETGRPASVLTRKAMSPNHKFRELRDQLPVEQRLANPKALTARPRTSRCDDADVRYDWIAVPSRSHALSILSRIEAIGGILARRSSALEHPGRSVAARARDSKWHTSEDLAGAAKLVRNLRLS